MTKPVLAQIFNQTGEKIGDMTAEQFQKEYVGKKPEDLGMYAQDNNGVPVSFMPLLQRIGGKEKIRSAHWKRYPGSGDGPREHLFSRNDNVPSKGLKSTIENGGKILITINSQLSDRQLHFTHMIGHGAIQDSQWQRENHGRYISASVHTAQDVVDILKNVKKWNGSLREQVAVRYHDAVLPYRAFYMGDKRHIHNRLYDSLQKREGGATIGQSIQVGFPRLMAFIPTDTLLKNPTNQDGNLSGKIMGNQFTRSNGKPLVSQLVFTNAEDALRSDPFNILHASITEPRAQYVLASPSVNLHEDQDSFKFLRWEIHDIAQQTTPIDDEGHKRVIEKLEKYGYNSSVFKGRVKYRQQQEENTAEPPSLNHD